MKILSSVAWILIFGALSGLSCRKNGPVAGDGSPASLAELNRALSLSTMSGGLAAEDVSALTNSPVLRGKRLPVPPPGKKLVIDPGTRQVVFADE
jgi:hypothetical protein